MFAKIIPYGTSFSVEALTYIVGDSFVLEAKIGQLVEIPYGKKMILGIIAELHSENHTDENIELKKIEKIISKTPILSPYQITMILRISAKYLITLHRILQIFLSSPLLARLEKYYFSENKNLEIPEKNENISKNFEIFLTKNDIISPEKILPFLEEKIFQKKIALIFPDDILLENFKNFFEKNKKISEKIFYIFSDATDTRRSQSWIDAFSGKYEILAWTRKILLYNLLAFDEIWYFEDSFSREYWQYPVRIEYTDFLAHIASSEEFSIKIFSSIPRLKTLSMFHYFDLKYL